MHVHRSHVTGRLPRGTQGDDRGFTLIELVITLVLLPLIIGGIVAAVLAGFQDSNGISARLADSHDAQITSAYFVRDIETSQQVSTNTASSLCPTSGTARQLLGLSWPSGGSRVYVSYGISTTASPPTLIRRFCSGGIESDTTVSHGLFTGLRGVVSTSNSCASGVTTCAYIGSSTQVTVVVSCLSGRTDCANAGPTSAFPIVAYGIPGISTISVSVTDPQSGYHYSLSASPRDQDELQNVLPPGSTAPAALLLGSGTNVVNCGGSGHGGPVTVNGTLAVDSAASQSIYLQGGDTLVAGQVYSQNPATSGSADPVQPPSAYRSTSSQPYGSGPTLPDPYATLPDPNTSGMTVYTTTNSLPGPGVYTNAVSLNSTQTIPSGIYVFEGGISFAGNPGTTFSGSNVFFFIGIPNAPPGAPQPASYAVSGNASIKITAPTSGTYTGFVIFQSRYDSNTLTVSGNGTNATYGGIIYAPDATVYTGGNGATFVGALVANTLTCGGNGGVSVGYAGVQTTPASSSVVTGASNTDSVSVIGNPDRGSPTGTVTFYVCGPTVGPTPCTSTANQVGSPVALTSGANNISTATSAAFTPTAGGTWCFAGSYSGDANYGASSDTSVNECFTVNGPTTVVTFPTAGGSYIGSGSGNGTWTKADSCTPPGICGTASDVGGTIVSVKVSLQAPNGKCWDGNSPGSGAANFTATCDNYVAVSGTTSWSLAWPGTAFGANAGTYTLKVQATDSNGITVAAAPVTFKIT